MYVCRFFFNFSSLLHSSSFMLHHCRYCADCCSPIQLPLNVRSSALCWSSYAILWTIPVAVIKPLPTVKCVLTVKCAQNGAAKRPKKRRKWIAACIHTDFKHKIWLVTAIWSESAPTISYRINFCHFVADFFFLSCYCWWQFSLTHFCFVYSSCSILRECNAFFCHFFFRAYYMDHCKWFELSIHFRNM